MADLERGQRIKALRDSRHMTQEALADELDLTLRGYQEWEAGGGIKWDNVKKLAKFHDVDPDYVMNGPKPETPDLLGNGRVSDLEARLDQLARIVEQLAATTAELAAAAAPREKPSKRSSAPRKSASKRK